MKFNYFNQNGKLSFIKRFSRVLTKTLSLVIPETSGKLVGKILMNPHSPRNYQFREITPATEINVETRMGPIHLNLFGEGKKVIVLNHGWGDNSLSFQPMIVDLVAQGFCVAAIDHIGHGKSAGNTAHLPAFIDTLELIISELELLDYSVEAIVGHSMGGMATLGLSEQLLKNRKIFLIAVPIDFFNIMFHKVENAGISRHLLIRVLENITKAYNTTWQQLASDKLITKNHANITFLHDVKDRYAPIDDIKNYVSKSNANLITTDGLGHRRILSDRKVIETIATAMTAA